jgi:hypothetical protein
MKENPTKKTEATEQGRLSETLNRSGGQNLLRLLLTRLPRALVWMQQEDDDDHDRDHDNGLVTPARLGPVHPRCQNRHRRIQKRNAIRGDKNPSPAVGGREEIFIFAAFLAFGRSKERVRIDDW